MLDANVVAELQRDADELQSTLDAQCDVMRDVERHLVSSVLGNVGDVRPAEVDDRLIREMQSLHRKDLYFYLRALGYRASGRGFVHRTLPFLPISFRASDLSITTFIYFYCYLIVIPRATFLQRRRFGGRKLVRRGRRMFH